MEVGLPSTQNFSEVSQLSSTFENACIVGGWMLRSLSVAVWGDGGVSESYLSEVFFLINGWVAEGWRLSPLRISLHILTAKPIQDFSEAV